MSTTRRATSGRPWSQVLRAHILPLTNCAFNKSGDKFITVRPAHHIIHHMHATSPMARHVINHMPATLPRGRHVIHHVTATSPPGRYS